MKSIKEYINESLLDDEDDLIENNDILIRGFIEQNYTIFGSYTIKDDVVDVNGNIIVRNRKIKSLTNGLFSFGKVDGIFNCQKCISLTSLEGAPKEVNIFQCMWCTKLTSLKESPKIVKDSFMCNHCSNLKTLEGAPEIIGGSFHCSQCKKLTSLKGIPKVIPLGIYCYYCPNLKSIDDAPKGVKIFK